MATNNKLLLLYKCRNCGGRVTRWADNDKRDSIPQQLIAIFEDGRLNVVLHQCVALHSSCVQYGIADIVGAQEA